MDDSNGTIVSGCSNRPAFSPAQPQRLVHPPVLSLPRQTCCPRTRRSACKAAASEEARRYGPHFVGPFAFVIDLGERKSPSSASDFRTTLGEPLSEARTLPAEFFSILLDLSADRLLSLDPRG